MSWSSWLKDGKNRQYEVSVKSFIENWTDKNLSSGYTGLGYKFELGENPTDLQGGLKSFLTTLSPSPRGSSETLFNALVHYETIESSSNGAPSPQMREFLSQKLASQPGTPGFFAIQKANPTDFMLGKLEFVARKLAFELDQYDEFNPTVRLGSKVSPKLYVKNRGGGVEFYEFRKTIKLRVPENRLNTSMGYNPLMTGHLCVITVLSLQHNVPEKTMEVRGQCKILRTLFIPVESGSDRFINGIGLKCSVNYGSQIDLKEKVPKINFHLFDFDAGEEYFSEVDRELQKQFWGHFREFFQEKLSYMFMVPSDTQRVLEDIRPLLQESLLTVINAEEKDWLFKENRSITVDSGTNDEGYITGKITSLRSRSDINISSLVAPVRSTLSTGTPLVTQPHTKPTKPVIKPTEPSPTPSAMSAQGKLSWNLSSSSITMSNQASGLELIGTNISSTTIPFAYIKVKFTAGEEFSDLFVAEPVTTQVASSPPSDSNTSVLFKSSGEILCGDPELEASPSDTGNWWTVIINPRDNAKVFEVSGHHSLNFSLQGRLGAAGDHPIEVLEAVADDKGKIIYKSKDLFVSIKVGTSA
ncbi:hypothetical protein M501DRAFT_995910 [Patellaria atrata CBS 101060]|uniref:Uncharacterized protein n=1 Tax=Patellaria atrata CBS 101060 TaxID=1346257 RepID=A0A9P4S721_9PEZI|nr:hypothetical protein M501DRAFT_995910 [Patellaria atrata CBS 101060]